MSFIIVGDCLFTGGDWALLVQATLVACHVEAVRWDRMTELRVVDVMRRFGRFEKCSGKAHPLRS